MSKLIYICIILIMGLFLNGCLKAKIILPVKTLEGHQHEIHSVAFNPTGQLLASCSKDIKLWDVSSGKCIATFGNIPDETYYSVAFSPNGKILASGGVGREVRLWDIDSKKLIATLSGHEPIVESVTFSPNGKLLASGSWDGTVRLWDTETFKCVKKLESPENYIMSVAFVPGTNLLVSVNDQGEPTLGVFRIWNIDSEKSVAIKNDFKYPKSVAVSPDGELVATGGIQGIVLLWNLQSHKLVARFGKNYPYVDAVAFSPDGTLLASSGLDGPFDSPSWNIRLWDVKKKSCVAILKGHSDEIFSVAFSPDGKLLASGSNDKTIKIWEIK